MPFDLKKFLFDTPIYSFIKVDNFNDPQLNALFYHQDKVDIHGYHPFNRTETTFEIYRQMHYSDNTIKNNGGIATVILNCKRFQNKFYFFIAWYPNEKSIVKVGQYPSVADFHIGEIKQYDKVISKEKLKEFTRAIGLAANGVGIGSFVYLRRIFESLIEEAYNKALSDKKITEAEFQKSRMDEKIDLLHNYLPDFLVQNKELYSILSLGIHELDENTCLNNFDTVRVGIEIILDEKLEELRKAKKIEEAQKKIKQIKGNIKSQEGKKQE